MTWRNTSILTPHNDVVIVPNAVIGRSRVTNFSAHDARHVTVIPVTVVGSADMAIVEQCAQQAARDVVAQVDGVVREEDPVIRFASYGVAGIQVNAAIHVESYAERVPVRHEYLKRMHANLVSAGVEMPTQTVVGAESTSARG